MLNNQKNLIKFIYFISILILLLTGFVFGYLYYVNFGESCILDPFIYGIEKINKMNNDEFYCSCYAVSGTRESFSFDKDGLIQEKEKK